MNTNTTNNTLNNAKYSDDELLRMLRTEGTKVTHALILAKRELKRAVAEVDALEKRLHDIDVSEQFLIGRKVTQ
jgi:hypothetical protein